MDVNELRLGSTISRPHCAEVPIVILRMASTRPPAFRLGRYIRVFSQTRSELGLPNRGRARGRGTPRWGSVLGLTVIVGST